LFVKHHIDNGNAKPKQDKHKVQKHKECGT
jgi:hypothetical protein